MATVNRYTKTVDNVYQPRSLQELMIAPAYKRQKHDELETAISQYESALAQADSMDTHSDRLKEEQQKLYDKMLAQRDKLNAEGFSQSSKSDFINFNKEYQQAVGPKGVIGKIQSAKDSYEKSREEILSAAMKEGHDLQATQSQIENQRKLYEKDFEETGKIKDFQGILPPSYHDLDADIKEMKAQLGHIVSTQLPKDTPYEIFVDNSSGFPIIGIRTEGKTLTMSNSQAIKDANEYLKNKWLTPGGDGYKSAEWNNMNQETIKKAIESGLQVMNIQETRKEGDNYQFMQPPKSSGSDDEVDATRRIVSSDSSSNAWAERGVDTKDDVIEQAEKLKSSDNPEDVAAGRRLEERMKLIEQEYRNNHPQITADYDNVSKFMDQAYYDVMKETGGRFTLIHNLGGAGSTPQDYDIATNEEMLDLAMQPGKLMMDKDEKTGEVTISYDGPAFDNHVLMKGGVAVEDYYNNLKHAAKIQNAYESGLNNKLQFEKQQDVKFNVEVFDKEAQRTEYNRTMYNLFTNHGLNSMKPLVAFVKDENTSGEQKELSLEEQGKLLEIITGGAENNFKFKGFIAQTRNGLPAIEVQYRVAGEGSKPDKIYTAQYELPKLNTTGTMLTGVNEAIINTMKRYGGFEGDLLEQRLKQSINYKGIYPTFHEEDFSHSSYIKQSMPTLSEQESLNEGYYNISDALHSNNLLINKFDIATQNYGDKQNYTIKYKDGEEIKNLTWADVIPNGNLDQMPANVSKYVIEKIVPFMKANNIKSVDDITEEHEKQFVEQLKLADISMNNYYDLLDLLTGK